MGYEVDFLSVGNGETSGDCIALRFGNLHAADPSQQQVIVIDGGFKESGEKLIEFIRNRYGTNSVDLVIATHLDRDHISGLVPLIDNMHVGGLLMQRPWLHAVRQDGDNQKEAAAARKSYDQGAELEALAVNKGVTIAEPLAGGVLRFSDSAYLHILGPDLSYYNSLLKEFDHNKSALSKLAEAAERPVTTLLEALRRIHETLDPNSETLDHVHKNTSAENNSSAILYFELDGRKLLFTGDAGVEALHRAADYALAAGLDLTNLRFLDLPHHGSKHNVDSAFLNRVRAQSAFISASKDSEKHPSPRVINALVRRNIKALVTGGNNLLHSHNAPDRGDYSAAPALELVTEFGQDD